MIAMASRYFPFMCGLSVTAAIALFAISRGSWRSSQQQVALSPRETLLPNLTEEEKAKLPYPPDALPGARDVKSPYGTFRCYEWGPATGRFVLLVHGISTPSLALYPLAKRLSNDRSCRVLLIDLWGRGYSDMPTDLPQDARLYTTQILLALASSPVSWTGSGSPPLGFDLIGYSLGGGIAANFAGHFPHLIRSLTLLTPAGLIRPENRSWSMRLLYSTGLVPDAFLRWLVKRSLGGNNAASASVRDAQNSKSGIPIKLNILNAPSEELPKMSGQNEDPLIDKYPHVNVAAAVNWQLSVHPGFVPSFISSIRHAPSVAQQEVWRHIAAGEPKTRVLILAGSKDPLILAEDLREDALAVIGEEHLTFKVIDCGHELPITCADQVSAEIGSFWALE